MIIELKSNLNGRKIDELLSRFHACGVEAKHVIYRGCSFFVTSHKNILSQDLLSNPIFGKVFDQTTEYQLCTRLFRPENTVIKLSDDVVFGEKKTVMMAGPCAVESEEMALSTAEFLRSEFGTRVFRAGAFKPRTSPYTFQGLEDRGLRILERVKSEFDMFVITEVKDSSHLKDVADVADIIQIGTKAMYNFVLLEMCGAIDRPILLKRGFMATIKEFLQAADFIISNGNPNVILCERGIRTFENQTRFSLDVCGASLIQRTSHLPLVLDPSHAVGVADLVPDITRVAAALGADGLLVEVHPDPANAKSDKEQALSFDIFRKMMPSLKKVCTAVDRELV